MSSSLLPPGWTEHTAPSGHRYYYNNETKQSTYKRPEPASPPISTSPPVVPPNNSLPARPSFPTATTTATNTAASYSYPAPTSYNQPTSSGSQYPTQQYPGQQFPAHQYPAQHYQQPDHNVPSSRPPRRDVHDRPKSKHLIPGCAPWVVVRTKLRRRFVHNPETQESFWKPPQHLLAGLIEFDIAEQKRKAGEPVPDLNAAPPKESSAPEAPADTEMHDTPAAQDEPLEDDDEEIIEEIIEEEASPNPSAPPTPRAADNGEFGEDDMAWQLAQLEGGDAADEGDEEWYEDAEETEADAVAAFGDMLTEHGVNPFGTLDAAVSSSGIVDDERYTLLRSMKARTEAFTTWSTAAAASARAARDAQAKRDPRIPYLAFLRAHATPKLFWAEFRRKHKKEGVIRDSKLADKEREKLYREHVTRVKLARGQREKELEGFLAGIRPSRDWHRDVRWGEEGALPDAILADVRFTAAPDEERAEALRKVVAGLPRRDELLSVEERAGVEREREERRRRDEALRQRARQVDEERRKNHRDLRQGKSWLEAEERERERAMKVGRAGLKNALEGT